MYAYLASNEASELRKHSTFKRCKSWTMIKDLFWNRSQWCRAYGEVNPFQSNLVKNTLRRRKLWSRRQR